MSTPRISLVIPAYNEEHFLPRLLDTVDAARTRFRSGADAIEVIVADNGSTDRTAAIAVERKCRVVVVEPRNIAAVRNGGAAAARGEILAFVDADMRIHVETFNAIDTAIGSGRFVAGATGVWLERWSLGLILTWMVMVPMVIVMKMDTGVVFCRRADFESVGGYQPRHHFGEDVQFLLDLRRLGRQRGQSLTRLRPVKAIASTRKFDEHGDWHYFTEMFRLGTQLLRGRVEQDEFVKKYWYFSGHRKPPKHGE
ncbi:MAG: glycosyltransferase [Acidobacteria bacterium]|nr:glycosyltransferase [Acidobacteriota bacterium]